MDPISLINRVFFHCCHRQSIRRAALRSAISASRAVSSTTRSSPFAAQIARKTLSPLGRPSSIRFFSHTGRVANEEKSVDETEVKPVEETEAKLAEEAEAQPAEEAEVKAAEEATEAAKAAEEPVAATEEPIADTEGVKGEPILEHHQITCKNIVWVLFRVQN